MENGTCSTISLNMNSTVWLLYYCLIKYCLKHCVCFYQVAIPQEILKIVSMFVVHVSSFILTWRIIRIVTIFIFSGRLRSTVFPFLADLPVKKSCIDRCISQWLLWSLEIKERLPWLDDGVNNDHSNVVV